MKYADKRGSPCAVIQGGDEKAKGEVQIKDLILGATITDDQGSRRISEEAGRGAVRVPEDQLVEAVRKVLARHNIALLEDDLKVGATSLRGGEAAEAIQPETICWIASLRSQ